MALLGNYTDYVLHCLLFTKGASFFLKSGALFGGRMFVVCSEHVLDVSFRMLCSVSSVLEVENVLRNTLAPPKEFNLTVEKGMRNTRRNMDLSGLTQHELEAPSDASEGPSHEFGRPAIHVGGVLGWIHAASLQGSGL